MPSFGSYGLEQCRVAFHFSWFFGDHKAVDEIARSKTFSHGLERFEVVNKGDAILYGNRPERLVLDDIQTEIPCFGAMLVEDFGFYDLQAICFHQRFVLFHRVQFDEHAFFDGLQEFLVFAGRQPVFLEPVRDGHRSVGT